MSDNDLIRRGDAWKALDWGDIYGRNAQASIADIPPVPDAFQDRVQPWMEACFGAEISGDKLERGDRLLEEVFELLQSGGYPRDRVWTKVEKIRAKQAAKPKGSALPQAWQRPAQPDTVEALVAEAVAQERERCAKVAEDYWSGIPESEVGEAVCDAVFAVAAAIRTGGKP